MHKSSHVIFAFFRDVHLHCVNTAVPTGTSRILPEKSSGIYDKTFRAISLSSVPLQNSLIYSLLKKFLCVSTSSYIFFDVS